MLFNKAPVVLVVFFFGPFLLHLTLKLSRLGTQSVYVRTDFVSVSRGATCCPV